MSTFKTPMGTTLPLLNLKGKDYLQVAHRIMWFREENPESTIITEFLQLTDAVAICRATIKHGDKVIAQGTKMETPQGFPDYVEKSESGAIGRALGFCGYGTQFAQDLEGGGRLADSPLPKPITAPRSSQAVKTPSHETFGDALRGVSKDEMSKCQNGQMPEWLSDAPPPVSDVPSQASLENLAQKGMDAARAAGNFVPEVPPICCGKKMMTSKYPKFGKNEWYCMTCKKAKDKT